MRLFLAAILIAFAVACGGGSPTSPPEPVATPTPAPTPPPVLAFIDGLTEAPLYYPDQVTPPKPAVGDSVTVTYEGYFVREQKWTGAPIALWPLGDGGAWGPGHYTQEIVYGGEGHLPLRRWETMTHTAVITPATPEIESRVAEVKARLQGVFADFKNAGGPAFTWSDMPTGDLKVIIEPADPCLAGTKFISCARTWRRGEAITRAELIFPSVGWALDDPNSMHSMGHIVGLSDWPMINAVMNRSATMHELESAAVHMMYQHRVAGNVEPDRDPGFVAASRAGVVMEQTPHD